MRTFSSRGAYFIVALICIASFSIMISAARTDSAIMDELAHIPAGYGYVHALDYRLNPEHPPLVKALAELPVLFLQPNFPVQNQAWTTDVNGQWAMGSAFLYQSGNNADQILFWSRLIPILLTILTIILIYIWSRELLGPAWAILPTFLYAFSPTILAHGHYVTTDVGASFGILLSSYLFIKFLLSPSRSRLILAGVGFGVAQLLKFSAVLLLPYLFAVLLIHFALSAMSETRRLDPTLRKKRFLLNAFRSIRSYIFIIAIGYIVIVYPVYFLFTIHYPIQKQVSDTQYILGSFGGGAAPPGTHCAGARCLADLNIAMAKHPATRPLAEYMLGVLMVLQRSSGGNTNYFLGQVSSAGSRLYFPAVYLLKEPLPSLILIFTALLGSLLAFGRSIRKWTVWLVRDYLELHFTEGAMLLFIVFYWAYSMRSPLNIGLRHLLPTFAFIYILASIFWKNWVRKFEAPKTLSPLKIAAFWIRTFWVRWIKYSLLAALLLWFSLETASAAPFFLSYFNEFGGGVHSGYRFVTDSNYDWGQDLLRLRDFLDAHPEIQKIAVDYFGGGDPKYFLGDRAVNWQSSKGNPAASGIEWLAVSVNSLQNATQPLATGENRNASDTYLWLTAIRPAPSGLGNVPSPDARAGTSIFIYHL